MTDDSSEISERDEEGYLSGQLLVAMPGADDSNFAGSVVYVCAHSSEGAMGIVINRPAEHLSFVDLLQQLELIPEDRAINVPTNLDYMSVFVGGPVETGRGFVLHSADYFSADSTLAIDGSVCLTATIDILRAIAQGAGPHRSLLALGYAGWAPGQLESEIQSNGWLTCPGDAELIFDPRVDEKYTLALSKLGVDPSFLVNQSGNA
jgi:putative transcriptional regulator